MHGKEPLPTLDASEVQEVRKELIAIRDKVNTLLDAIDSVPKTGSSQDMPAVASAVAQKQAPSRPPVESNMKTEGRCWFCKTSLSVGLGVICRLLVGKQLI